MPCEECGPKSTVVISGAGKYVEGELLKVAGSARADGDINVKRASVAGSLSVGGVLSAEELSVAGSLSASSIQGGKVSVAGAISVRGELSATEFKAAGGVRVREIKADLVKVGGGIRAEKIEGREIRIEMGGKSKVGEIKGDFIEIKRKLGLMDLLLSSRRRLYAKRIEGRVVYLRGVICDEVIGDKVYIGRGCRIGKVIYRESLKVSPSAKVGQTVRE